MSAETKGQTTIIKEQRAIEEQIELPDYDKKRKEALEQIDNAEFGWFHVRTCLVAGVGFFTDAYDLFAINIASVMLGYVYFNSLKGSGPPSNIDLSIKVSASVGNVIGQFGFGIIADMIGRKRIYGVELMIIVVGTVASALSSDGRAVTIQGCLIFWRFIMGLGIGGDYPLSAIFAMQGFGILTAAIVATIAVVALKGPIDSDPQNIDYAWRILLGMGAIPGVVALYFRLTIPETPRFTMDIERNIDQAAQDITSVLSTGTYKNRDAEAIVIKVDAPKGTWSDFWNYFGKWENGKVLLGTSLCWFFLDIAFYGIGLNNSIILHSIGYGAGDPYQTLFNISVGNIIIALLGTVPGYWVSVFTIDSWGRIPIQKMGFIALFCLYLIMGFGFTPIKNASTVLFIVIFTLSQFFTNFGPNTTTFVLPGEVFPTRYRSTGHGISAASGKIGAIVAQVGFSKIKDLNGPNNGIGILLVILSSFMLIGFFLTFLIPETKRKTLEELSNENQEGFVKGVGAAGEARAGLFAYRAGGN
ncbi:4882_t:CDS:2 [Acaulospora colombiana]|uniref:4882_t:CDS:1 n=1 Tax=Acaulospora colombiana TaxID=27376 RepID=A0ACA9KX18_9GLOM|nr:4882_t:CDS:2 [Acaulospora colombiana]